jgi:hypothetical protein
MIVIRVHDPYVKRSCLLQNYSTDLTTIDLLPLLECQQHHAILQVVLTDLNVQLCCCVLPLLAFVLDCCFRQVLVLLRSVSRTLNARVIKSKLSFNST